MGSWLSTSSFSSARSGVTVENKSQYHVLVFLASGAGPVAQCRPNASAVASYLPVGESLRAYVTTGKLFVSLSETWEADAVVISGSMVITESRVSDDFAEAFAREVAAGKIVKFLRSRARRGIHRRHVAAGKIVKFLLPRVRRNIRLRAAAVTTLQAAARARRVRRATKLPCAICMEDRAGQMMVSLPTCPIGGGHSFCAYCYSEYVRSAIDDGKMHIECAAGGCAAAFRENDVLMLTGRKTLAKFKALRTAAHGRYLAQINTGEAGDDGFRGFAREHTRACPSCSVVIYRHSGCDHMSCRCGRQFNWASAPRVASQEVPIATKAAELLGIREVALPGPPPRRRGLLRRLVSC